MVREPNISCPVTKRKLPKSKGTALNSRRREIIVINQSGLVLVGYREKNSYYKDN